MFKNAKIGDKVWYIGRGWGTIADIVDNTHFQIIVAFKNKYVLHFLYDGRLCTDDEYPTLFWSEFKAPKGAYKKPLLKDTKVLTWDLDKDKAVKRYFSHFDEYGKIHTFDNGMTRRSSESTSSWFNYEIVEEEIK